MSIEPLPTVTRHDDINAIREAYAQLVDTLEFLFNGGLDELNIRRINAEKIYTGTLDAGKVTVKVDYTTGASIVIDSNGMTINDGTKDTFRVDINGQVTMTGAQVQSADGTYPRIELSSSGDLLKASQDATHFIYITPDFVGGAPAIVWESPTGGMQMFIKPDASGDFVINASSGDVDLSSSSGDIVLKCAVGHLISVNSWNELYNRFNGQSLQTALNGKANTFSGYSGSFSTGTNTVFVSNGIITSVV